jgi:hypothetical protein
MVYDLTPAERREVAALAFLLGVLWVAVIGVFAVSAGVSL